MIQLQNIISDFGRMDRLASLFSISFLSSSNFQKHNFRFRQNALFGVLVFIFFLSSSNFQKQVTDEPYLFLGHWIKSQGHCGQMCQNCFRSITGERLDHMRRGSISFSSNKGVVSQMICIYGLWRRFIVKTQSMSVYKVYP